MKTPLLVFAGFTAGLGIAFWLQPSEPSVDAEAANRPASVARSDDSAVRAPRVRENASGRLDPASFAFIDRNRRAAAATSERLEIDLIVAGFAPDRAEWIDRRVQELRARAMHAQSEARRQGRPPPVDVQAATLRRELGDQDYERFLAARGVPTSVKVMAVHLRSAAERAGMRRGDEIFSYDGQRVFDVQDLNELALGGTRGEPVVLDVRRDGENLRLVLPRGPIGVRDAPVAKSKTICSRITSIKRSWPSRRMLVGVARHALRSDARDRGRQWPARHLQGRNLSIARYACEKLRPQDGRYDLADRRYRRQLG